MTAICNKILLSELMDWYVNKGYEWLCNRKRVNCKYIRNTSIFWHFSTFKILVTSGISLLTDIVADNCKPTLTQLPPRQTLTLRKIARESKCRVSSAAQGLPTGWQWHSLNLQTSVINAVLRLITLINLIWLIFEWKRCVMSYILNNAMQIVLLNNIRT